MDALERTSSDLECCEGQRSKAVGMCCLKIPVRTEQRAKQETKSTMVPYSIRNNSKRRPGGRAVPKERLNFDVRILIVGTSSPIDYTSFAGSIQDAGL